LTLRLLTTGAAPDGTLFGIDTDGTLRWYRYNGSGEESVGAGVAPWLDFDTNSGNPIGNGWGEFSWIGAGIHGTLVGVDGQGNLRAYYYTGNGESDWAGDQNWAPQSGTILASDFGKWKHLALLLDDGDWSSGDTDLQILAVNDSAEVWVYYWRTGNLVGGTPVMVAAEWTDFQYVFGANLWRVFAVDTSGVLHWFRFTVVPTDPSFSDVSVESDDNNGNAVAQGWDGFSTAAAGWNTTPGGPEYISVYAVDSGHNLHWYGYSGNGAEDASGATGWVTGSDSIISGSW
jgi:Tachylectin